MIGTPSPRRGFALIELIVVVAIGLLGLAVLLPALQGVREAAHKQETVNNLKSLGIGLHNVSDAYKKLPPAFAPFGLIKVPTPAHVHLLPFVEQVKLYNSYVDKEGKGETREAIVSLYRAEEEALEKDKAKGAQNFAANLRVFSDKIRVVDHKKNAKDLDGVHTCVIGMGNGFPDGTSNTVVLATKFAACGEGGSRYAGELTSKYAAFFGQNAAAKPAHPSDETATFQLLPGAKECRTSPLMAQSLTKKGLLVCMGDAVVRGVSPEVSAETWNRAMHPSDGFPNGGDWDN